MEHMGYLSTFHLRFRNDQRAIFTVRSVRSVRSGRAWKRGEDGRDAKAEEENVRPARAACGISVGFSGSQRISVEFYPEFI